MLTKAVCSVLIKWQNNDFFVLGLIGFVICPRCCVLLLLEWNTDYLVPGHFQFLGREGSGTIKKKFGTGRVPGSRQGLIPGTLIWFPLFLGSSSWSWILYFKPQKPLEDFNFNFRNIWSSNRARTLDVWGELTVPSWHTKVIAIRWPHELSHTT